MTHDADSAPLQPRRRPWQLIVLGGVVPWLIAIAYFYLRPSLWILDLVLVPAAWILLVVGILLIAWGVFVSRSPVVVAAILPIIVLITVLVAGWWQLSPRAWFAVHRPLYNAALSADPGDDMYGNLLPLHLRYLAANGRMSGSTGGISADGIRFFPQWIGVPDDAGGFLYSPSGSPEGYDMYGMQCRGPVALGGGWWMCGMRD